MEGYPQKLYSTKFLNILNSYSKVWWSCFMTEKIKGNSGEFPLYSGEFPLYSGEFPLLFVRISTFIRANFHPLWIVFYCLSTVQIMGKFVIFSDNSLSIRANFHLFKYLRRTTFGRIDKKARKPYIKASQIYGGGHNKEAVRKKAK